MRALGDDGHFEAPLQESESGRPASDIEAGDRSFSWATIPAESNRQYPTSRLRLLRNPDQISPTVDGFYGRREVFQCFSVCLLNRQTTIAQSSRAETRNRPGLHRIKGQHSLSLLKHVGRYRQPANQPAKGRAPPSITT